LSVANRVTYFLEDFILEDGKVGYGGAYLAGKGVVGYAVFIRINRITISAGASGLLLSFCSAAVSCIMPQKASFLKTFCHKLPDFT
jgi:hypothetical protein